MNKKNVLYYFEKISIALMVVVFGFIVDLIFENVKKRLEDKQIHLEVSEKAKNFVIEEGYNVSFGARPLKRFIQTNIETLIAKTILSNNIAPNSTLLVDAKNDEIVVTIKK